MRSLSRSANLSQTPIEVKSGMFSPERSQGFNN